MRKRALRVIGPSITRADNIQFDGLPGSRM